MTDPRRLPARLRDPSHVPFGFARYLGDVPDVFQSAGPGGAGAPIKWPLKPSKLYAKYAFKLSGVVVQKGQQVPSNLYVMVFSDDGPVLGKGWYALPSNGPQGAINNFVSLTAPRVSGGIGGGAKRAVDPDVHNAMRAIQAHHRMQASIPAREKQMRAMAGTGALGAGPGEACGPFTGWCDSGYTCGSNGVCEADAPTGGGYTASGCQSSADCGAGYICDNGTCLPQGGYGCQSDGDCGPGETCDGDGNCIAPASSSGCQSDDDCGWGQSCSSGECVWQLPDLTGGDGTTSITQPGGDGGGQNPDNCPNMPGYDPNGMSGGACNVPITPGSEPTPEQNCRISGGTWNNGQCGCPTGFVSGGNPPSCFTKAVADLWKKDGTWQEPPPPGAAGTTWSAGDKCGANAHILGADMQCHCDTGFDWAAATGLDCKAVAPGTKTGTGPGGGGGTTAPPRGAPPGGKGGTGGTGGTGTNALGDEKTKLNPWLLAALGLVVVGGGGAAVYYATRKPSGAKPAGKLPAHKTTKKKR